MKHTSFFFLRHCLIVVLCLPLFAAGCAAPPKGYKDDELRQVQGVMEGTVLNVGVIQVTEFPDYRGPALGAAAGGAIGAVINSKKISGGLLRSGGGIVLGAVTGYFLNDGSIQPKRYDATELTVELENGGILLIVLGNSEYFIKGDFVRIIALEDQYVRVQHQ